MLWFHTDMYMVNKKCYVVLCAPRRTGMDFEKISGDVRMCCEIMVVQNLKEYLLIRIVPL